MKLLVAAASLCTLCSASLAIVASDSAQYIDPPPNAIIGYLRNGTCVPIGERYALTANHVGVKAGHKIEIDGVNYTVSRVIAHPMAPSTDLKVLEIAGPPYFPRWVPVHPDPHAVPVNSTVYIGGFGKTTGAADGSCIDWADREERWATNNLEGHIGNWSWYRYDAEMPNEGMAAVYDSGSPLIVADDGACSVAVLAVASTASTATGPTCDGHTAHYTEVDPVWLLPFTGPRCEGDLDADGDTDVMDFAVLVSNFGNHADDAGCLTYRSGDLDQNGVLDLDDVSILILSFGCRD